MRLKCKRKKLKTHYKYCQLENKQFDKSDKLVYCVKEES